MPESDYWYKRRYAWNSGWLWHRNHPYGWNGWVPLKCEGRCYRKPVAGWDQAKFSSAAASLECKFCAASEAVLDIAGSRQEGEQFAGWISDLRVYEDTNFGYNTRTVHASFEDEAHSLRRHMAAPLPVVEASFTHLHQLLTNLLSNAIKYAGDAPPRIRVEAEAADEWLELRVIDHGLGVPAEHRARVFEMFQRLHTREEIEGSGVGLAICRRIVERLGGEIRVEDTPGRGATFVVRIPQRRVR